MQKIKIKLLNNKYDVLIDDNLIINSGNYISKIIPNNSGNIKVIIITDDIVNKYYANDLINSLNKFKYVTKKIVIPHGEKSKSFSIYEKLTNEILEYGINRNDFIIALGGGVVGDLCGFLASTLLRGISFVQIPTTLLSQIDSSIGGKTAINVEAGKNLVGTFYQPKLVLIDPKTLQTLDKRNLFSGFAEVIKSAIIADKKLFSYCINNFMLLTKKDTLFLQKIIFETCCIKAKVVKRDEYERLGIRATLNLGHTFGHVYEKLVNYDANKILHGEAVFLGLYHAIVLAKNLKVLRESDFSTLLSSFNAIKLFALKSLKNYKFDKKFVEYMLNGMKKDKKSTSNSSYNVVLPSQIGKTLLHKNVSYDDVKKSIIETLKHINNK